VNASTSCGFFGVAKNDGEQCAAHCRIALRSSALRLHRLSPYVCSMRDTASFSVRVPRELHEELAAIAEQDRRSVSNVIRNVLEDFAGQQRRGELSRHGHRAA
jgi:hypothetical protein